MERLTRKYVGGGAYVPIDTVNRVNEEECVGLPITKLARYEDAEEQGLLLWLPCKVGSDVFCISSRYTLCSEYEERRDECSCEGCEVMECDSVEEYYIKEQKKVSYFWIALNLEQFGKTIFLTREEAEQKLKEMEAKAK